MKIHRTTYQFIPGDKPKLREVIGSDNSPMKKDGKEVTGSERLLDGAKNAPTETGNETATDLKQLKNETGIKPKEIDLSNPIEIIDSVQEDKPELKVFSGIPPEVKGFPFSYSVVSGALCLVVGWMFGYFKRGD